MGSAETGFGFHAEFSRRPDKKRDDWWSETLVDEVLLAPVRETGDLATATRFSCNQKKPVAITSPKQLASAAATWNKDTVQLFAGNAKDPTWALHYRGAVKGPAIGLLIKEARDPALRERFAAWVVAWSRGLAKAGCDLTVGYLAPFGRSYPRPRPPLEGTTWPLGQLELYLGRRWHELRETRRSVLAKIVEARLVPGVRRTTKDDVVRISFACDLRDDAAVARARALGDRWLTPLVPTSPEAGWNEHGDELIVPGTPTHRKPFTFFDKDAHIGYWALVRDPEDGSIDEARWNALATIARKQKDPRGKRVAAVRLIAPVREEALALVARAQAAGFDMVTYPEGDGAFWRVFAEDTGSR